MKTKPKTRKNKKDNQASSNSLTLVKVLLMYKYSLLLILILIAIFTGLSLVLPTLIGEIVKSIETSNVNYTLLWYLGFTSFILFGFEILLFFVGTTVREKIGFDLRQRLMNKLTTLNFAQVNNLGIGQVITLFSSDVNNIKDVIAAELTFTIKAIFIFIGALVLIFVTSWKLGIITFLSLPIIILSFFIIFKSVTKYFSLSQKNQTDLNNTISQNIYGSSLVRVQNSQVWETTKFNKLTNESKNISFKIIESFAALIPIINLVSSITSFGILYFGALSYIANQIKLGDINAYISYYGLLIAPIFIIGFNSQGIAKLGVSFNRINDLLESEEKIESGKVAKNIQSGFKLVNVSLEFAGKKILKNINLEIELGKKTAILGPTGAGKSSLFSLLNGMILPTSGEVLIDEIPIKDWDSNILKSKINTVFQDSLIFNGNIKYNVILNRVYNEVEYKKAITTATINELDNEKTNISELGQNLSGGQKQRLTLARALYGNPQILLLDDFTARVDNATKDKITNLLSSNYPDTTIVSISQNIADIKDYDQIIVLMEGEVIAVGSHEELLKTCLEYLQIEESQKTLEQ